MISIDIREIPCLWTTCDKSINRQPRMVQMLDELGFKNVHKVSGPIETPYTVGVAKGYIEALSKFEPPFLILEDDATLVPNVDHSFEFSYHLDSTHAIYLGTSHYGRLGGKNTVLGGVVSAVTGPRFLKISNMLSLHAILYLDPTYTADIHLLLSDFIDNPEGGCDDPIADRMSLSSVYALRQPMFYQADGHSERATITPLIPLGV